MSATTERATSVLFENQSISFVANLGYDDAFGELKVAEVCAFMQCKPVIAQRERV